MQTGISIYPGLDNSFEENAQLIDTASQNGITRLFTSFHIPETNISRFKAELGELLHFAHQHHMEIISDVSPGTLKLLGMERFRLSSFQLLGIHTLRLDYGYSIEEIAELSRNTQHMRIQLNASTITSKILTDLLIQKADFDNIDALHNFYPREGTGLSEETLVRKTAMLHKAGIQVGAFIPSQYRRRSPLRAGLPTLEMHRCCSLSLAARHLAAMGMDSIFIADSLPSDEEIQTLSRLRDKQVTLHAKLLTNDTLQIELLKHTFTSRVDEARDAVRTQESRTFLTDTILPENTKIRPYGAVTIDNKDYLRYMGELQIIKRPQPADKRTNVAAQVLNDDTFLINYIVPGKKFSFEFI
jgi:uncharacterized protein